MHYQIIDNQVKRTDCTIGIIAATPTDTRFGIEFLEKKNIKAWGISISRSPQEQTDLQALNTNELTARVINAINVLAQKKTRGIIIYCNSLSGAIDLDVVRKSTDLPVVTPLDVYTSIAPRHRTFGLIAANCQSLANIERTILSANADAIIIGFGNLKIVEDIENQRNGEDIVTTHGIPALAAILKRSGSEILILGCTHFTYLTPWLQGRLDLPVFEPSEAMVDMIIPRNGDEHAITNEHPSRQEAGQHQ